MLSSARYSTSCILLSIRLARSGMDYQPYSSLDTQSPYLVDFQFGQPFFQTAEEERDNALFEELTHSFIDYEPKAYDRQASEQPLLEAGHDEYEIEQESEEEEEEQKQEQEQETSLFDGAKVPLPSRPRPAKIKDPNRILQRRRRNPKIAAHPLIVAEPFACGVIGCRFAAKGVAEFKAHLREEHPIEATQSHLKLFKCAMCSKAYRNSNGMKVRVAGALLLRDLKSDFAVQLLLVSFIEWSRVRYFFAKLLGTFPLISKPAFSEPINIPGRLARGRPRKTENAQVKTIDNDADDSQDEFLPEDIVDDEDELGPSTDGPLLDLETNVCHTQGEDLQKKRPKQNLEPLICPVAGCEKAYRQLAGRLFISFLSSSLLPDSDICIGIRYHLLNGHGNPLSMDYIRTM